MPRPTSAADPPRNVEYARTGSITRGRSVRSPCAVDVLIGERRVVAHLAVAKAQHELATLDRDRTGAVEGEADHRWIGTGSHDEVVLELALVAVVDDVDARIDVPVTDARIRRYAGLPAGRIAADERVHRAGERCRPSGACVERCADERRPEHRGCGRGSIGGP